MLSPGKPRIQDVPEGVAQKIPAKDKKENENTGNGNRIPIGERIAGSANYQLREETYHLPPVGITFRYT